MTVLRKVPATLAEAKTVFFAAELALLTEVIEKVASMLPDARPGVVPALEKEDFTAAAAALARTRQRLLWVRDCEDKGALTDALADFCRGDVAAVMARIGKEAAPHGV